MIRRLRAFFTRPKPTNHELDRMAALVSDVADCAYETGFSSDLADLYGAQALTLAVRLGYVEHAGLAVPCVSMTAKGWRFLQSEAVS